MRNYSLDYLRGLMAFSVMVYHFFSWYEYDKSYPYFLEKIGTYGVSVFFILSGISLVVAYKDRGFTVLSFFVARFARIFPLFFLALLVTISLGYLAYLAGFKEQYTVSFFEVVLNFLLLFSFFLPSSYIPVGGWSIGNEVVYYFLFLPVFVFLLRGRLFAPFAFLFFSIACFVFYNVYYPVGDDLRGWYFYIEPFNHFIYFVSGIFIGFFVVPGSGGKFGSFILLFLVVVFIFYPVDSSSNLFYGIDRMFLSFLLIVAVCLCFASGLVFKGWAHRFLTCLGDWSYSIYLLHPLVALPILTLSKKFGFNLAISFIFSIAFVVVLSRFVYIYFEVPSSSFLKKCLGK